MTYKAVEVEPVAAAAAAAAAPWWQLRWAGGVGHPFDTWDRSAGAGTRIADSWCERCGCMGVSCSLSSSPHGR